MRLRKIIQAVNPVEVMGEGDPEVVDMTNDTRKVKPSALFFAIKGNTRDGHDFLDQAFAKGAIGAVVDTDFEKKPKREIFIRVSDTRKAYALAAQAFYGHPSRDMTVIGITGTNGKTTTSYLLESILLHARKRVGVVGTVNYRFKDEELSAPYTTPDARELYKMLHRMRSKKVDHLIIEVSSHALAQYRVWGIDFCGGVFTNLTQDHLDYHGSMEEYRRIKMMFFTEYLSSRSWMVLNVENELGKYLYTTISIPKVGYGLRDVCDIYVENLQLHDKMSVITISTPIGTMRVKSPLKGYHNVYNILAAVGAGISLGLDLDIIALGIEGLKVVSGRLEEVSQDGGPSIFIDYAHTPHALLNVLREIRRFTEGRVILVFGCGGERDRLKRPEMGRIAVRFSDISILTSDNPRGEDPEGIIRDIEGGMIDEGGNKVDVEHRFTRKGEGGIYEVWLDRREAIQRAIEIARVGDTILVAGKGHETYQILGEKRYPFDDREVVREILKEKMPNQIKFNVHG